MLSVVDLEKLDIPPMLDETKGALRQLDPDREGRAGRTGPRRPRSSHLLDIGCGRGRIARHLATTTGGQVSGYNIDPDQIENANDWAGAL